MLKSENRIKKRKEFGYIYKHGLGVYSPNLVIMYTDNKYARVRIGLSVSKKVGKAYARNKVKRVLRSIMRLNIDKIKKGKNYIVVARPSVIELNYAELETELLQLFDKIQ